jgi:superfamily I DNA/RNA helicase
MKLIYKIKDREAVDYLPTDKKGRFYSENLVPRLEIPGTHMILCRCNYHLKRWIQYLTLKGIPWKNPYRVKNKAWNPADTKTWRAMKTYNQIRNGLEVTGEDLIRLIEKMMTEYLIRGVKTHRKKLIEETCGFYGAVDIFYLNSSGLFQPDFFNFSEPVHKVFQLTGYAGELIKKHGAGIVENEPRCIIGTVHSVKGGEADHVWVDRSTSLKIATAIQASKVAYFDEVRVGYVACTRARETLGLLAGVRSDNNIFT